MSDDDRPDHVYLADFGLSKLSLQSTGLTDTGTFLGTLDYVAPEQIEGRLVDGRADQYALACAAFELLTGSTPFRRDDRQELMAMMYAQLSEPPPALSGRRPDLPFAADSVFARALAKAPDNRYRTCREFANALSAALGLTQSESPSGRIGRPLTEAVAAPPGGVLPIGAAPPIGGAATPYPADRLSGDRPRCGPGGLRHGADRRRLQPVRAAAATKPAAPHPGAAPRRRHPGRGRDHRRRAGVQAPRLAQVPRQATPIHRAPRQAQATPPRTEAPHPNRKAKAASQRQAPAARRQRIRAQRRSPAQRATGQPHRWRRNSGRGLDRG